MRVTVLEPVGARVDDLRLDRPLEVAEVETLTALLAVHGVLAIPGQDALDDAGFVAFLRQLGPLTFTDGETPVDGFPDLNVVSNVGRTTPPKSSFHVDTSYVASPPAYTALRAVTIPEVGGQTQFTSSYRAYETLPDETRRDLAGRTVTHVVTGVDPGEGAETSAEHPVFRPHPVTGRTALYLTTPARCAAVSGLSDEAAAATVQMLFEHATADENQLRHSWRSGDVVIWDNHAVLHRADHDGVVGDRVMHRGMVATYR